MKKKVKRSPGSKWQQKERQLSRVASIWNISSQLLLIALENVRMFTHIHIIEKFKTLVHVWEMRKINDMAMWRTKICSLHCFTVLISWCSDVTSKTIATASMTRASLHFPSQALKPTLKANDDHDPKAVVFHRHTGQRLLLPSSDLGQPRHPTNQMKCLLSLQKRCAPSVTSVHTRDWTFTHTDFYTNNQTWQSRRHITADQTIKQLNMRQRQTLPQTN